MCAHAIMKRWCKAIDSRVILKDSLGENEPFTDFNWPFWPLPIAIGLQSFTRDLFLNSFLFAMLLRCSKIASRRMYNSLELHYEFNVRWFFCQMNIQRNCQFQWGFSVCLSLWWVRPTALRMRRNFWIVVRCIAKTMCSAIGMEKYKRPNHGKPHQKPQRLDACNHQRGKQD